MSVSSSPADNPEFSESHLLFNFNNLKQALTKNSIIETTGFIPFLTASKIVVNFKAADSGLLITIAFGIRPEISVEMKTIIKNNVRSKNLVLRELSCQKSLASPLPSQPIAINEILTPNCDEIHKQSVV